MQLTSAERIAQSLQQALAAPPPELLTDLSAAAKSSIQAVIDNIQFGGAARRPNEDQRMDDLIYGVVFAVRNLLYVSAVPSGQIPSHLIPRNARDPHPPPSSQSPLKPAQRKVTATLSRLVLSARAMQYDSGSSLSETLNRIEVDAEELERAVLSFVLDVQRTQHNALPNSPESRPLKRLRGVFMTANIGLGLVGAGAAAGWKGFGWVSLDDEEEAPKRILGTEVVTELSAFAVRLDHNFSSLATAVRAPNETPGRIHPPSYHEFQLIATPVHEVRLRAQDLVTQISAFLSFVSNIHVARHVDIDGIRQESSPVPNDLYSRTVEKARTLVRELETAVQSLYDDGTSLLIAAQMMRDSDLSQSRQDRAASYDYVDVLSTSLKANLAVVQQSLEGLLSVGHDQSDTAQGDYNGSIEWRMSRLSVIDTQFGGAIRPMSSFLGGYEGEDVVDMEMAFTKPQISSSASRSGDRYDAAHYQQGSSSSHTYGHTPSQSLDTQSAAEDTLVGRDSPPPEQDADGSPVYDDDGAHCRSTIYYYLTSVPLAMSITSKRPPKTGRNADKAGKLRKLMGDEIPESYLAWYLRPNYSQTEILIDPDGSVRGGTVPALVEQLTAHDHAG